MNWRKDITDPFESYPDLLKVNQEDIDLAWKMMEFQDQYEKIGPYEAWISDIMDTLDKIQFIMNLEKVSKISIHDDVSEWIVDNDLSFFKMKIRDDKLNRLID